VASDTEMRRLAFIKHMFQTGVEESRQPRPMCVKAILSFHDSVELFLDLAGDTLGVNTKNTPFLGYWDKLNPALETGELTQRERMRRLNDHRNSLKHGGRFPSAEEIDADRAYVSAFFVDNTPTVFGVGFEEVSLIMMVSREDIRKRLETARESIDGGRFGEALDDIAIACFELVFGYSRRFREAFIDSGFYFGQSFRSEAFYTSPVHGRELQTFVRKVAEALDAIRPAMRVLALGLDYKRYAKFRVLTPIVYRAAKGGTYRVLRRPGSPSPTAEICEFCVAFTIEAAIHLQEFEAGLDLLDAGEAGEA